MEQKLLLISFFSKYLLFTVLQALCEATLDIMSKTIKVSAFVDLWDTKERNSFSHMPLCLCTFRFVCQECPFLL